MKKSKDKKSKAAKEAASPKAASPKAETPKAATPKKQEEDEMASRTFRFFIVFSTYSLRGRS